MYGYAFGMQSKLSRSKRIEQGQAPKEHLVHSGLDGSGIEGIHMHTQVSHANKKSGFMVVPGSSVKPEDYLCAFFICRNPGTADKFWPLRSMRLHPRNER